MRRCETPSMCASYGGCFEPAPADKVATWIGLFIGTGLEMNITPEQVLASLTPKKLKAIIEVLRSD
jgi:hypothetical protein